MPIVRKGNGGQMINKTLLTRDLIADEGMRLKTYTCTAGKLTIGVGRNLDDNGISVDEAHLMLQNDIDIVCAQLDNKLPWWRDMTEVRQRVLANMCFNMGIGTLLKFINTLEAMKHGQYDKAADGMLKSLWAKQVGNRAKRLARQMKEG